MAEKDLVLRREKTLDLLNIAARRIERLILLIRGHKVMLDADLADLYGVETRILIQAVKRNSPSVSRGFHVPTIGRRSV
jgi:ORF6N domain